ncbi:MAG: transposase [Gammaproteobacteria bacterium]|jgi:transposase
MTRKRKPYKTYTKEFKLEALRLMEQSDRPASEIAMQLGIRRNQLLSDSVFLLSVLASKTGT